MNWWHYLILVNIYLVLFYGFYILLLSRETFFKLNRFYLVAAALLSFFIPVIQSDWVKNLFITQQVQYRLYSSPVMLYTFKPVTDTRANYGEMFTLLYLAGIAIFTLRFLWQLLALKKEISRPNPDAAYSFFKKIRLTDDNAGNAVIGAHEHAHASQWHSADILLMEAVMIINWFNPVVYLYRFAIKHIHEFIADEEAIKTGTAKADYALLLLSQTFDAPTHQLVNPFFNHSLLKQRIAMLQKNRSQRIALIKYGFSAPLFILMLILSSATVSNSKTIHLINNKAESVLLSIEGAPVKNNSNGVNTITTQAVGDTTVRKTDPVFTSVEQVPEFPGGLAAFGQYLGKNIKYPAGSREKGVQGRVIISFIVETDGSLTDVRVVRGIAADIDAEALRVLRLSPNWSPGIQNGKPVRVAFSVPISFTLDKSNPAPNKTGALAPDAKTDGQLPGAVERLNADTAKKPTFIALYDPINKTGPVPLFIVDGKEVPDISSLNAKDIKSIDVYKDKPTLSRYGAKAANGLVVVTTKRNGLNLNAEPIK